MPVDWKDWRPYLCGVNGKPASILVDLDLHNLAPIQGKDWLLWAWVYFLSPRHDGLSSSEEAPTLYRIEDALHAQVPEMCNALPCGRITTAGRREFYFYGETDGNLQRAVEVALSGFSKYRFDVGKRKDPSWEQYLSVLYPSPEDIQRIGNMDTLDELAKNGDVHSVPREVQHWLYFPSHEARSLFRSALPAEFEIASEGLSEGTLPYMISVLRSQPIDQASLDATVLELFNLCHNFDGEYDGWEARVITQ